MTSRSCVLATTTGFEQASAPIGGSRATSAGGNYHAARAAFKTVSERIAESAREDGQLPVACGRVQIVYSACRSHPQNASGGLVGRSVVWTM
jgi:hypothetical protein